MLYAVIYEHLQKLISATEYLTLYSSIASWANSISVSFSLQQSTKDKAS